MNRSKQARKASVESSEHDSKCTALAEKQTNTAAYPFNFLALHRDETLMLNGPAKSTPVYVKGKEKFTCSVGSSAIIWFWNRCLYIAHSAFPYVFPY